MATNSSSTFSADVLAYLAEEVLPLAERQLVAYQFGDPLTLPKGRGTTYTATRYNRIQLPYAPLSEGVPPVGETMTLSQVTATAQQWGDSVTITDVAEMTVFHPPFQQAMRLMATQLAETLDRNTYNTLNSGTQINYAGSVGSRGGLGAGNVMSVHEVNRATGALKTLGALQYLGNEMADDMKDADGDADAMASRSPSGTKHYAGIIHPLVVQDMRDASGSILTAAWTYQDKNHLYNDELGEINGIRFCQSNMVPSWTGKGTSPTGTAGNSGNLAAATYYIQVTGSDTQNQYESNIYSISTGITTTGTNGSISVTTPNVTGFTYSVYVSTSSAMASATLGLTNSGPTVGPFTGNAIQLPANTTVIITGAGVAQQPPAAPASTITVYPTYIIGKGAYGQVVLDDIKFSYLDKADKSDKLNQLLIVGWKTFYGTIILNNTFFMRIEAASAFSSTFG